MTARTLVVLRHAKSDWSAQTADRDRPLNGRGRRQAPEAGHWLAGHLPPLDLALVSPAARAQETWRLAVEAGARAELVRTEDAVYTFDGDDLLQLVQGLSPDVRRAVLVGHNPALADLVWRLSGYGVEMSTASLAVLEWSGEWGEAGATTARLRAHGRPATEAVPLD